MICSAVEDDVVPHSHSASAAGATMATTTTTAATSEPLRPLALAEDLPSSVRSSLASNASMTDVKREQHPGVLMAAATATHAQQASSSSASSSPSTSRTQNGGMRASAPNSRAQAAANANGLSTSSRSKRARFENKIRLLAQYMRTLSMGLSHRQRSPPATVGTHRTHPQHQQRGPVPLMVKRRSQVSLNNLSQYSLPRSAPDVLDPNKSARSLLNGNAYPSRDRLVMTTRNSSSSQQTALSWDEIIAGAVFVEENEVMSASPRSRKRGRPSSELFEDSELRKLLKQCGVPESNVEEVVKIVVTQFGTCQLDLTVLHELVGGNSVVVVGMLVFACIDCGEELLDLHSLPAFLLHIQSRYDPKNPFHNACHAADVLHSFFIMLWTTQLGAHVAVHNQIAALFAAIMHDIDHIGLTNDFLVKTNHAIAAKYPTRAPMEEMHATVAMDLLTDAKFNVLAKLCNEQLEQVVTVVRETIQSTALCFQKDLLRDVAAISPDDWEVASGVLSLPAQVVALRCAMHVSDISQTMKPFAIHNKWVARLNEEQFLQGDLDAKLRLAVCPDLYFRDKWSSAAFLTSQIWFLQNLALPAAKCFNSIPWLHAPILEENLQANIVQWQAQLSSGTTTTTSS